MTSHTHLLVLVTGTSSGIGYELAKHCAEHGFDLLVAARMAGTQEIAPEIRHHVYQVWRDTD